MTSIANKNLLGPLFIVIGLLFLFTSLDFLGVWVVIRRIWPLILILIGLLVISGHIPLSGWTMRTGLAGRSNRDAAGLFGDIRLSDLNGDTGNIERSLFIGDIVIDLTEANLLEGESRINVAVVIGDITVIVPPQTAIAFALSCYMGSLVSEHKTAEGIFQQLHFQSEDFAEAPVKVRLKAKTYIGNIRVRDLADRRRSNGEV